jgi:DNA polymerase zeta
LPEGNYFFFSPSLQDCNRQEALECQALTLEPQSGYYDDPVVVCDYTALYPSLMIAYNLCYTTCAGKLDYHSTREEMRQQGRTTGKVGPMRYSEDRTATVLAHHMKSLVNDEIVRDDRTDRAYATPTGTIFVSEAALRGVLPQVLDEMLTTRAMLKKAAKQYKKLVPDLAPSVLRQLEARQLGTFICQSFQKRWYAILRNRLYLTMQFSFRSLNSDQNDFQCNLWVHFGDF